MPRPEGETQPDLSAQILAFTPGSRTEAAARASTRVAPGLQRSQALGSSRDNCLSDLEHDHPEIDQAVDLVRPTGCCCVALARVGGVELVESLRRADAG